MALQEQDIPHEHKETSYHLRPIPCACGQDVPAPEGILLNRITTQRSNSREGKQMKKYASAFRRRY